MERAKLREMTQKGKVTRMGTLQWLVFLFWSLISQVTFLFPLIIVILGMIWILK